MSPIPALPCYLNGSYTTLDQAQVSVLDRGFIFGDGIYEVIPIYNGRPFRLEQHLARLNRSLAEVRIANPLTAEQWTGIVQHLIAHYQRSPAAPANTPDQLIYLQISRGVAMRDHVMPEGLTPTVFVMINGMRQPSDSDRQQGVRCITAEDFRWERAHIKSTSLLGAVFARQLSHDVGAAETIMFRDGFLSEAAACNVWVVKDGQVLGTPKDNLVLEGIRYGLMEELCAAQGIPFSLRRLSRAEVAQADELLLTSATKEVLPISLLDGQAVGKGKPGPVYEQLFAAYQQAKSQSPSLARVPS
jgi:D-alanine transaminase